MKYKLNEIVGLALDIGERMLKCGAEVSRVEDTIERIVSGYGIKYKEVFVLNTLIIATIRNNNDSFTESRRIKYHNTDLLQLEKINQLSRDICKKNISRKNVLEALDKCKNTSNNIFNLMGMMLAASSFTIFFGGNIIDAIVSLVISIILFLSNDIFRKRKINDMIRNFFSSFIIGIIAITFVKFGIGHNFDKIIIGDIMLLIPGLSIFISINDIFKGDTMSGISRFTEGLFLALMIAGGIGLSLLLGGAI